ncbi:MAG: hypothetical protein INR71_15600, partial [Terriglobus roseus]|nr:hypothetical protein [Terriglobus roseus]
PDPQRQHPQHHYFDASDAEASGGEREIFGTPKEEFAMSSPAPMPAPPLPEQHQQQRPSPPRQLPQASKIPTPKQSKQNMSAAAGAQEMRNQASMSSLGGGAKNRFGFPGGKA